jgi:hypothetical protein
MKHHIIRPEYKYNPKFYFVTTFIVTYAFWFAGAYMSHQNDKNGLYMLFILPGLMAPFLISVAMIATSKNSSLKKDYLNRLFNPGLIQLKMLPHFFY